eukprot:18958_5
MKSMLMATRRMKRTQNSLVVVHMLKKMPIVTPSSVRIKLRSIRIQQKKSDSEKKLYVVKPPISIVLDVHSFDVQATRNPNATKKIRLNISGTFHPSTKYSCLKIKNCENSRIRHPQKYTNKIISSTVMLFISKELEGSSFIRQNQRVKPSVTAIVIKQLSTNKTGALMKHPHRARMPKVGAHNFSNSLLGKSWISSFLLSRSSKLPFFAFGGFASTADSFSSLGFCASSGLYSALSFLRVSFDGLSGYPSGMTRRCVLRRTVPASGGGAQLSELEKNAGINPKVSVKHINLNWAKNVSLPYGVRSPYSRERMAHLKHPVRTRKHSPFTATSIRDIPRHRSRSQSIDAAARSRSSSSAACSTKTAFSSKKSACSSILSRSEGSALVFAILRNIAAQMALRTGYATCFH